MKETNEKKSAPLEVEASTYLSRYEQLDEDLIFFNRVHRYPTLYDDVDVLGNFNFFAFGRVQENQVFVQQESKLIPIQGNGVLFIPQLSMVHWHIKPCEISWEAFSFQKSTPAAPMQPMFYPMETFPKIRTRQDIFDFFAQNPTAVNISVHRRPTPEALRIKQAIDSFLGEELTLLQIADAMNLDPYEVTRIFKRSFGLNPVEYRTKQRVLDSMFRLLTAQATKSEVSRVAFDVGFADLSRFNKQFKKHIDLPPSKFLYGKNKPSQHS